MDSARPTSGGSAREALAAVSGMLTLFTVLGRMKAEFDGIRSCWWPPAPSRYRSSSHHPSATGYGHP